MPRYLPSTTKLYEQRYDVEMTARGKIVISSVSDLEPSTRARSGSELLTTVTADVMTMSNVDGLTLSPRNRERVVRFD
ncbi:hypothetical protein EVAR_54445_1 [Eumeta japonica]|uniref:Uncharacterized protein n=1 Tax=Eumeta variegata TaxID=151549 RepID=A0A4C1XI98_EUMVA|nr:hypothetical protein EVAR_54445_1 [Eumeta japonica]